MKNKSFKGNQLSPPAWGGSTTSASKVSGWQGWLDVWWTSAAGVNHLFESAISIISYIFPPSCAGFSGCRNQKDHYTSKLAYNLFSMQSQILWSIKEKQGDSQCNH